MVENDCWKTIYGLKGFVVIVWIIVMNFFFLVRVELSLA